MQRVIGLLSLVVFSTAALSGIAAGGQRNGRCSDAELRGRSAMVTEYCKTDRMSCKKFPPTTCDEAFQRIIQYNNCIDARNYVQECYDGIDAQHKEVIENYEKGRKICSEARIRICNCGGCRQ